MKKNLFNFSLLAFLSLIIFSCNENTNKQNQASNIDTIDLEANFVKAKKIFYNLPSPPDVANLLFSDSNLSFDHAILNGTQNVGNYETSTKQALNFGIYSTDFCFASLFEQNQIAINYFASTRILAQSLGLSNVVGQDTIRWLAENFTKKDSLIDMITVVYRRSEAYFNDNGKYDLALLMAMGGWVEGLHIAINLAQQTPDNSKLRTKILEQKLSMDLIMQILETNKSQKAINYYSQDFNSINTLYEKLGTNNVDSDIFKKFALSVDNLRQKMIQ